MKNGGHVSRKEGAALAHGPDSAFTSYPKTRGRRAVVLRVDLDSEKPVAKLLCCYERRAGTGKRIMQWISAERSVAALGCLKTQADIGAPDGWDDG
jgi:hypothetical protein